jgi:hypothetical protein
MTWPLRILRWTYCAFIAWSSFQTFLEARANHHSHAFILSIAELAAIAAFLFKAFEIPALAVLLAVFAIAGIISSLEGDFPIRFLFYATTAAFIVYASRHRTGPPSPTVV